MAQSTGSKTCHWHPYNPKKPLESSPLNHPISQGMCQSKITFKEPAGGPVAQSTDSTKCHPDITPNSKKPLVDLRLNQPTLEKPHHP